MLKFRPCVKMRSTIIRGRVLSHLFRGTACFWSHLLDTYIKSKDGALWSAVWSSELCRRSTSLFYSREKVAWVTAVCCMLLNTARYSNRGGSMKPRRWCWRTTSGLKRHKPGLQVCRAAGLQGCRSAGLQTQQIQTTSAWVIRVMQVNALLSYEVINTWTGTIVYTSK